MTAAGWVWVAVAAILAVLDWAAVAVRSRVLERCAKPAVLLALLAAALTARPVHAGVHGWLVLALCFGLVGDVALSFASESQLAPPAPREVDQAGSAQVEVGGDPVEVAGRPSGGAHRADRGWRAELAGYGDRGAVIGAATAGRPSPDLLFSAGLASFLLGHLCYCAAMLRYGTDQLSLGFGLVLVLLALLAFGQRVLAGAQAQGGTALTVAVAAYITVLGSAVVLGIGTASLLGGVRHRAVRLLRPGAGHRPVRPAAGLGAGHRRGQLPPGPDAAGTGPDALTAADTGPAAPTAAGCRGGGPGRRLSGCLAAPVGPCRPCCCRARPVPRPTTGRAGWPTGCARPVARCGWSPGRTRPTWPAAWPHCARAWPGCRNSASTCSPTRRPACSGCTTPRPVRTTAARGRTGWRWSPRRHRTGSCPAWDFLRPVPLAVDALRRAADGTVLVGGSDDPYCPGGVARAYGAPLKMAATVIPDAGALTAGSGYGPWPAVLDWCGRDNLAFRA